MHNLACLTWLVAYNCCAVSVFGSVWTSPDGAISGSCDPKASNLVEGSVSADADRVDNGGQVYPVRNHESSASTTRYPGSKVGGGGIRETINGTLVQSKAYKVGGCTVFGMAPRAICRAIEIAAIQSVVAVGDQVYTLVVMGIENDILSSNDAKEFIDSLRILGKNARGSDVVATNESQMHRDYQDVRDRYY